MKRSTNRIALPSCWEQLRTGKAWRRLCLALLVAVMTLTTQTAWAQTSGQQQTGGESQPYNPEQQEEVEVTLEIVNKLLDDYYKTGTDASNTSLDNIAYIVFQNIPEGEGALKDLAQTTQENVSLAGGKLNELKGGLEANNTAVSSANTITGNLDAVNELVEVCSSVAAADDSKIFEFTDAGGNKTTIMCINEFGDRAATFDAQMKLADQALQNAQNTQNATSNTEAVNYAIEAKNYLNNANSALTSASSLITSAETVISTARTDLTDANSAFTGVSNRDLNNMQISLSNAKDGALNAKNSAATLKTNSTNNTNIDANIKTYIEITASKTADLYNEIKPLKVSSAPGGAALEAVNQKITGLEGNVSWAKQCLAIMQERYNTLNTALTALGLLPVEPDPVSYIDENGTRQNCTDYTVLDGTETSLAGGWYVVNSNVTVDGRINLTGDMNLILGDGYTLDVKGIYIPLGKTLTIYAQSDGVTAGKIVSKPTSGAGIGGMSGDDNGNIVICGGIIEATGGKDAAAIGGGDGGDGGTITINGGNITANGPTDTDTCENGAGIGGGNGGDGGTITITGGTITTYSRDGAGIGGGDGGDGGNITITGGEITSTKVNQGQGARIGGGCDGAPGTITINGGTVTAKGGADAAGIGGGKNNAANGTVTINGGVINASGQYGIGVGEGGADVAIILGWTNASDRITASSYNGTVTIVDGKAFTDLTNTYLGTLTAAEKTTIANVELQPLAGVTLTKDGSGSLTASFSGTTEDEVSIPVNVTVDNVTIDRTFEYDKACTLYLPFGIAASKVLGGMFHTFTSVDETKDPWEVKYTEVTGDIAANTPYIFLPNDKNGGKITVNNGTDKIIVSTANPHTTQDAGNNWKFIGTYERIKWTHDTTDPEYDDIREGEIGSIYGFAANNSGTDHVGDFVKVGNNVWINPMRAYLKRSTSLARAMTPGTQTQQLPDKMKVVIVSANGTTTEIGTLDTRTGEISLDEWYSLDGQKLDGKPTKKGIYINNGKKVAIK